MKIKIGSDSFGYFSTDIIIINIHPFRAEYCQFLPDGFRGLIVYCIIESKLFF